ncbi:MAG: hypothetical protein KIS78_04275 [Labilithrix sp.]|nr:hypothetical protein [Labilithrix sp.]
MSSLVGTLAELAAAAPSQKAFREAALDCIAGEVVYDGAVFHALSPRVPFATAVVRGLEREAIEASMKHWDRWAVELGRFREIGIRNRGVATDRQALPARGPTRALFERAFGAGRRARAAAFVHLIARERILSAMILVRFRDRPFSDADVSALREAAPVLALADGLHRELDHGERASVPTAIRCRDQRLTDRQREIVELMAMGHTNAAIARALGRSPHTVRNQLADVMRRLGAANRADVVRLAVLR